MKKDVFSVLSADAGKVIASRVKAAKNPWTRFWGLMGKESLDEQAGLWIEPCNSIHSCFMRFAFDAVFLDKEGYIVDVVEVMRPWRFSHLVKGGRVTLELPEGRVRSLGLEVGQQLITSQGDTEKG